MPDWPTFGLSAVQTSNDHVAVLIRAGVARKNKSAESPANLITKALFQATSVFPLKKKKKKEYPRIVFKQKTTVFTEM